MATKYLADGLGNNNARELRSRGHFGVSEVVVLAVGPLVTFIVTLAVATVATSLFPPAASPRAGDDLCGAT